MRLAVACCTDAPTQRQLLYHSSTLHGLRIMGMEIVDARKVKALPLDPSVTWSTSAAFQGMFKGKRWSSILNDSATI